MKKLGVYLSGEMKRRNQSRREFARHLHTSPDTIARMIDKGEDPTIEFLRKVSSYTGTSLLALLKLSFPNEIREPRADLMIYAEMLNALPETKREFFIDLIKNANLRVGQTGDDESKITIIDK